MRILPLMVLAAGVVSAQVPGRPALPAGADTNDAAAYYHFAFSQIQENPTLSVQGFTWATRLDPSQAPSWYGLWVASILSLPDPKFYAYMDSAYTRGQDSVLHAIDSLDDRAFTLNPLIRGDLFELVLKRWVHVENAARFLNDKPWYQGWLSYSRGDYKAAEGRIRQGLREDPKDVFLRWWLARTFIGLGNLDSALAELRAYRDAVTAGTNGRTMVFLASHEETDYAIGWVQERRKDYGEARHEYETALTENLAYTSAHVALAHLATLQNDTTFALKEMELATEGADPAQCYQYGVLLWASHRGADAAAQFRRAIAADSDYAPPYLSLAYLTEGSGDDSAAIPLYRHFIAGAAASMTGPLATAHHHLDAILARRGTH